MFVYYLRLAAISLKRNPILSALMVAAIALGIGASMTTITVNYMMSADPIPDKSNRLFYVQVDNWDPNNPFNGDSSNPPNQLTWTDANNLMEKSVTARKTAMAKTGGIVEPADKDIKPFEASVRLAYGDFFPMFNTPFLFGSGWDANADQQREQVVVLTKEMNDKIFGGQNSVGQNIVIADTVFRVVGVLDTWQPVPKFYDVNNGAFDDTEDLFIPFLLKEELELPNWGNTNCWKSPEGEGFKAFLQSECINFQMWIELDSPTDRQEYVAFLDRYVEDQKSLGRFPRPLNNRISNVMEWMETEQVVSDDARIMMWLSFMFLLVCLLNTIGLLLAKFTGKAAETSLRRAVGASKSDLFFQHLVETGLIGLAGGIAGLGLAQLGLQGIKMLYGDFVDNLASLDFTMVVAALVIALVSSIAAGLYPTWRACNIAPASQLKSQ